MLNNCLNICVFKWKIRRMFDLFIVIVDNFNSVTYGREKRATSHYPRPTRSSTAHKDCIPLHLCSLNIRGPDFRQVDWDCGDECVFMRRTSTALMKWNRIGAVFDHDVTDTRLKATWGRLGAAHDSGGGGVLAAQHGHKRTEWVEKQDTLLLLITSPNLDQSSHFFHLGSKRVMK